MASAGGSRSQWPEAKKTRSIAPSHPTEPMTPPITPAAIPSPQINMRVRSPAGFTGFGRRGAIHRHRSDATEPRRRRLLCCLRGGGIGGLTDAAPAAVGRLVARRRQQRRWRPWLHSPRLSSCSRHPGVALERVEHDELPKRRAGATRTSPTVDTAATMRIVRPAARAATRVSKGVRDSTMSASTCRSSRRAARSACHYAKRISSTSDATAMTIPATS